MWSLLHISSSLSPRPRYGSAVLLNGHFADRVKVCGPSGEMLRAGGVDATRGPLVPDAQLRFAVGTALDLNVEMSYEINFQLVKATIGARALVFKLNFFIFFAIM